MKNILLSSLVGIMLVGCGGGSSSDSTAITTPPVTNAGNLENQYGYFGGNTLFGTYTAARMWALADESTGEVLVLSLSEDGEFILTNSVDILFGDYGVSYDTKTIRSSGLNDISIVSTKKDYFQQDGTEPVDCYEVSGGDRPIIMCPDIKYSAMKKNMKTTATSIDNNKKFITSLIKK